MVFFYFGPTPDSWALGNGSFSRCKNLPAPLQDAWNRLAQVQPDASMAGADIEWLSASPDGDSYAIMTKGDKLLSNRPDILAAACPTWAVEHISFSPNHGWLIRFADGTIQHHDFPLPADLDAAASGQRQRSQVRSVFFGARNSLVIHTEQRLLLDRVPVAVRESFKSFTSASDMQAAGVVLGRATTLCPWDGNFYFVEEKSVRGDPSRYWYKLPTHEIPEALIQTVVATQPRPGPSLWQPTPPRVVTPGPAATSRLPREYGASRPRSPYQLIPLEARNKYEKRFIECSGDRSHVTGVEIAMMLAEMGLSSSDLGSTWQESDRNKDGLFDKEEFVQAMWLSEFRRMQTQSCPGGLSYSLHPPGHPAADMVLSSHWGTRHSFDVSNSLRPQAPRPTSPSQPQHRPASDSHPLPLPPPYVAGGCSAVTTPKGALGQDQSERIMTMTRALVCRCCKRGLVAEDIASYCRTCGDGFSFCMDCSGLGASCPHRAPVVKLVQDPNLPGTKANKDCNRCWRSIKKGSLTWHCDKCFDPELCAKCWRKGKYCKHFEQGKVTVRIVNQNGSSLGSLGDALDIVGSVFGV